MIAYYPFNGSPNDIIGNNNPFYNNATLTSDRFGNANNAYAFNGSQYIRGDCSNYPTGSRTMSLWFKIMDSLKNNTLFGYGGGAPCGTSFFGLWGSGAYGVFRHCVITGCSDTNQSRAYQWNNLIITTGNDTTKLYLNGTLFKTCAGMDFDNTNVFGKDFVFGSCINPTGIGAYSDVNVDYLTGSLDDIVIYDTILKQNEIDSLVQFSYTAVAQQNSNALHFDGINDRVQIQNDPLLSPGHITLQAWVSIDNFRTPYLGVITKRNCCGGNAEQWTMQTEGIGFMHFHATTDSVGVFITDTTKMQTGVWVHFTATYDGHTANLYRNGVLAISDTTPRGNITAKSFPVVIGDRDGGNDWWPGAIDEVRIWDRALSQKEILANINCHLNGNELGLIAYYDFNQGTPAMDNSTVNILPDLTSHGLNGSLQNFALTGISSNWIASPFTDMPVSITIQPSDTVITVGESALFITGALNSNASFQWQTDSAGSGFHNINNGSLYTGTTNDTLLVNNVTLANNQLFRCAVSLPFFCPDTSAAASLMVTTVLPVTLLSFNAVRHTKKVLLKWVTENESGRLTYSIERSADGFIFYPIGIVPAINNNVQHNYDFTDEAPFAGFNYYRLKIFKADGKYAYSDIIKVVAQKNLVNIYPNPSTGKFTIEFERLPGVAKKTILIRDIRG